MKTKLAVHQEVVVQNRRFPAATRMRLVQLVSGTCVWKAVPVHWPTDRRPLASFVHPSEIIRP